MTFIFYSCYLTHHQLPFCLQMYHHLGDDFRFIAQNPIEDERVALGFPDLNELYPFVIRAYESDLQKAEAQRLVDNADIVMLGGISPDIFKKRLSEGKLTFLYSERLYKKNVQWWKLPIRAIRFYRQYGQYPSLYLLCASAYTAGDFAKSCTFLNKAYKWGYFPEVKRYADFHALMDQKKPHSITFAGRFIDWKHPELVIEVASKLLSDGYHFQLNMIGGGELHETISTMIIEKGLQEHVHLLGVMSPEEVRQHMEQSEIYVFPSDRGEGWGAVLNEAMNSGCAVVASHEIGAVPFLIENEKNGLVFQSRNMYDLYLKVKYLLDTPSKCKQFGAAAYETLTSLWNAEVAVPRLLALCKILLEGKDSSSPFESGPCSTAKRL